MDDNGNRLASVTSDGAPQAIGPYSQAVICGELVFTSGQIALAPGASELVGPGVSEQTEQVLANLGAVLEAAGASLSGVIKTTVFLADMGEFASMNEVYGRVFGPHRPARSTVQAAALPKAARVEIECVARRG